MKTTSEVSVNASDKGTPFFLTAITLVATIGGFLFGFDTAVVNGAEKSLVDFYITKALDASNYQYAVELITQYRVLVAMVFTLVFIIIAGLIIRLAEIKKGVIINGVILIGLLFFLIKYLGQSLPSQGASADIQKIADSVKGFVVSSALTGCIIGGALAGFIAKALGRRAGLIISAATLTVSAFGAWQPELFNVFGTLPVFSFIIYRIIGGIGIGLASLLSPMYIAEISPAAIRGKLVSWNQFAIVSGMVIIYFVNYLIARSGNDAWLTTSGWRWMFFSGVIPSIMFLILLILIPETPRYLMLKGRDEEALKTIIKISGKESASRIREEIRETLHEKNAPWLSFGFLIIFLGIILSILQQFAGINVVLYYAGNIFRNMGASTDTSLLQTIIVGAINMLFTIIAVFTVDRFGRRPLMITGALIMAISMLSLGFAFFLQQTGLLALFFMLLYIAGFAMSWGPVTWVILSEIFPNSIRGAMSVPVAALWIANLIVSWTFPILNDNIWLTEKFNHGFSYWIYSLMCIIAALFVYKFIPETKGKSLEEIEKFWKKRK
ncbi:MAG: sugar porter family MFS transporter [Bacteroidales bacterium]|nr:sugar porter family MFS transporter [Bacteroidales bacterium]